MVYFITPVGKHCRYELADAQEVKVSAATKALTAIVWLNLCFRWFAVSIQIGQRSQLN